MLSPLGPRLLSVRDVPNVLRSLQAAYLFGLFGRGPLRVFWRPAAWTGDGRPECPPTPRWCTLAMSVAGEHVEASVGDVSLLTGRRVVSGPAVEALLLRLMMVGREERIDVLERTAPVLQPHRRLRSVGAGHVLRQPPAKQAGERGHHWSRRSRRGTVSFVAPPSGQVAICRPTPTPDDEWFGMVPPRKCRMDQRARTGPRKDGGKSRQPRLPTVTAFATFGKSRCSRPAGPVRPLNLVGISPGLDARPRRCSHPDMGDLPDCPDE
jgi:hypothetical protein